MGSDEQGRTLMVLGEQRMEVSEPGGRQGNSKAIIFAEVSFGVRSTWRGRRVMGLFYQSLYFYIRLELFVIIKFHCGGLVGKHKEFCFVKLQNSK